MCSLFTCLAPLVQTKGAHDSKKGAARMDELTRELRLMEVIAASDAMINARVELEDAAEDMDSERRETIRRYVFPLLEREHERLGGEYRRLRGEA